MQDPCYHQWDSEISTLKKRALVRNCLLPVSHVKAVSGILLRKKISSLRSKSTGTKCVSYFFTSYLCLGWRWSHSLLLAKTSETIAGIGQSSSGCIELVCCCVCWLILIN